MQLHEVHLQTLAVNRLVAALGIVPFDLPIASVVGDAAPGVLAQSFSVIKSSVLAQWIKDDAILSTIFLVAIVFQMYTIHDLRGR